MYIARVSHGYIVKRMPDTGHHHAPQCPSYEPSAESSALGCSEGNAISNDPETGTSTLKLGFALYRTPGRSLGPVSHGKSASVSYAGPRLSLLGLLQYLWDQAELTRWHPGFAGKRTWATVRRHLLRAADRKFANGIALLDRLYVPETFSVDERNAINARRLALWQSAVDMPGRNIALMVLIGEAKEIAPTGSAFRVIVKHVPDQGFALPAVLHTRVAQRFERELMLWARNNDVRMLSIGTFDTGSTAGPHLHDLALMPVNRQWLPVEDEVCKHMVNRLVDDGRAFIKCLHDDPRPCGAEPCALLTDCIGPPLRLHLEADAAKGSAKRTGFAASDAHSWVWRYSKEPMPSLPAPCSRQVSGRTQPRGWPIG
jgi:hypothetical protein